MYSIALGHSECSQCHSGQCINESYCTECSPGYYNDETGSALCNECEEGSYSNTLVV